MKLRMDFGAFIFLLLFLFCFALSAADEDDDEERAGKRSRCPWIRGKLANGRVKIRSRGRVAKFLCNPGFQLVGKRFANCVGRFWNNPIPVCVAPGCAHMEEPSNGQVTEKYSGALLDYECHPGYALYGSNTIYCNGLSWNDSVPVCEVALAHPQIFCDFEDPDLCGWSDDPSHDFNWKRHQYGTPSGHVGTGPSYDHSFGKGKAGFYMYEEASSPRKENDTSRLFSPVYSPEYSPGCFVFWYHMYGATMGSIRIYIKPESYVFGELVPSWEKNGDQGNQWLRGNVTVPTITENFQVVIEGVRGSSYVGDSAIDDVHLLQTDCSNIDSYNVSEIETVAPDSCRGRCMERNETAICGCTDECFPDSCCRDYEKICLAGNDSYSWNVETEGFLTTVQPITTLEIIKPPMTTLLGDTSSTSMPVVKSSPVISSLQTSSEPGSVTLKPSSLPVSSSTAATNQSTTSSFNPYTTANYQSSSVITSSWPPPISKPNPEVSDQRTSISTTPTKRTTPVVKTSAVQSTTGTIFKTPSFTQAILSTAITTSKAPVTLKTTTIKVTPPRPTPKPTPKSTTLPRTSPTTTKTTTRAPTRIAAKTTTKKPVTKSVPLSSTKIIPITIAASTGTRYFPTTSTTTANPTATKITKPSVTNTVSRRTATVSKKTTSAKPTKAPSTPMPGTKSALTTLILTPTFPPNTSKLNKTSTKALISSTARPPGTGTDILTTKNQSTSPLSITSPSATNTPPKTSSISSTMLLTTSPPSQSSTTTSFSSTAKNISSTSVSSRIFQTTAVITTRTTFTTRTAAIKSTTQIAPQRTTILTTQPPRTRPSPPPPPRTRTPPPRTRPSPPPRTRPPPPPRTRPSPSPSPPPRTRPSPPPPPPRTRPLPPRTQPTLPSRTTPTLTTETKRIATQKISMTTKITQSSTTPTKTDLDSSVHPSVSASHSTGNANIIAGVSVVIVLLVCLGVGVSYVFLRKRNQTKLSDDSELRFLPESEVVEFSDPSFTDCLMDDA